MFAHALFAEGRTTEGPDPVIPVPPGFGGCVARLKAVGARSSVGGSKGLGVAALRGVCGERYKVLETKALGKLIARDWVVGGAAEAGVSVSEQEVQRELEKAERERVRLEKNLVATGRTVADLALETRVQLLAEGMRQAIGKRTGQISRAQVVGYFHAHRQLFGVPRRRDLEIARVASRSAGERVKREIASGKSFASVVKRLPLQQPIYSEQGLVMGYQSGMYRERPLNQAIFAARPNVLSGPVSINLGYYVFEVTRVYPARPQTLAQAQATIRRQLPGELYEPALAAFISRWRARWTARTNCQPGYVVAKCRQAGPPAEAEDPYNFT